MIGGFSWFAVFLVGRRLGSFEFRWIGVVIVFGFIWSNEENVIWYFDVGVVDL